MTNLRTNIDKLLLFIQYTKKPLPNLQLAKNQATFSILGTIKNYFTDDDILFYYQKASIFQETDFMRKLSEIYVNYIQQTTLHQKNAQFVQFVKYWMQRDEEIKISYKPYEDMVTKELRQFLEELSDKVVSSLCNQKAHNQNIKKKNQKKFIKQISYIKVDMKNKVQMQQKSPKLNDYTPQSSLRFLHQHYSKKFITLPKDQTFQALHNYYTTMDLTQWIIFAKEMNLLNITPEQQSFQSKNQNLPKLDSYYFKRIFQKYSRQFVMNFNQFKLAVAQTILIAFGISDFENEGYKKLELYDEKSFRKILQKIGQYIPKSQVIFRTIKNDQKNNATLIQDKVAKLQPIFKNQSIFLDSPQRQINKSTGSHRKFYKSRQEKQQDEILEKMSLQNLRKFKMNKEAEAHLCSIIFKENKITNDHLFQIQKQNKINHNNSKNYHKNNKSSTLKELHENSGIIKRIDRRINKIVQRQKL